MKKKIFVITGEVSGDILASKIIDYIDIKKIDIKGIVGSNLKIKELMAHLKIKKLLFLELQMLLKIFFILKKKLIKR